MSVFWFTNRTFFALLKNRSSSASSFSMAVAYHWATSSVESQWRVKPDPWIFQAFAQGTPSNSAFALPQAALAASRFVRSASARDSMGMGGISGSAGG